MAKKKRALSRRQKVQQERKARFQKGDKGNGKK